MTMATKDYWREEMSEADARDRLGPDHFDWALEKGAGYCAGRASGYWYANEPELYAAYRTAERIATAS
jgi:hypothetical protein